ncbi:hypothetical protein FJY84_06315 [Candidatus Bathyarchaeota archaeon]|nr:hypothetical protein [Candidatus Bathyarchaeota archaeon]
MKIPNNIKDYFAGAAVAFSIVLLVNQGISFLIIGWTPEKISANEFLFAIIQLLAHIIGGFLAGYLIAKKRESDHIISAATVGLFAYIAESIFVSLFGGNYMPDFWALGGFLLCAASAAYIVRNKQLKKDSEKNKES